MFCGMCGKPISSEVKYCPNCGAAVTSVQNAPNAHQKSKAKPRTGRIVFSVILILVILTAGALFLWHIRQKTTDPAPALTIAKAQDLLNTALESVYETASSDNEIAQTLADTVHIEVVSVAPSSDGFIADCEVAAPNLAEALSDYILSDTVQPAAYSDIIDGLLDALRSAEEMHESFRIELIETDDGYQPLFPEAMVEFCSGNAQELLHLLNDHFQGGGKP